MTPRCTSKWGFHTWGPWTIYAEGTKTERRMDDPAQETREAGRFIVQQRQCSCCLFIQRRRQAY